MTKWLLAGMLLFRLAVGAQQQNVSQIPDCSLGFCAGNGVPTFSCNPGQKYAEVNNPGVNFTCTGSPQHWVQDAGGGGTSITLTTTGNTGAATLGGATLNIPQYQGVLTLTTIGSSGAAALSGNTLNIPVYPSGGGGSMTYPAGNGIPIVSNGNAWGTTVAAPTGTIVGTTDTQTLNNKTVDGVTPTTFGFLDATSSIQNQFNVKAPIASPTFTGAVTLAADPTANLQAATKQYVDANAGGVTYPSATNHAIPAAMITGGVTSLVDSSFSDDTNNTFDSEPFYLVGEYQQPTGTANSSNNYVSNVTNWLISYWNGTTAVQASWNVYAWVAQGASPPATVLTYYGPANLTSTSVLYAIDPGLVATSGVNYNSPKFKIRGATWNGSASVLDDWNWQAIQGSGTNPTSTLTFTHAGTSGTVNVSVPSLTATAGTPGIGNNGAAWTAGAGVPSGSCAVSSIYSNTSASSASTAMYVCYPANTWNAVTIP